jgi:formylglycine-generating enzyme required for sulfatase activity
VIYYPIVWNMVVDNAGAAETGTVAWKPRSTLSAELGGHDEEGGVWMTDRQSVDITELATVGEQFPPRLRQLGFRLLQGVDAAGQEGAQYIVPPLCAVPAGPFLMGSDPPTGLARRWPRPRSPQDTSEEGLQHTVTLEAYQIGTYPLTVAEYACAVRAHAVGAARRAGEKEEVEDGSWQPQRTHPDHPVIYLAWWQAIAYTRWLAQVTGEAWRLPTEAEWEKAARGTDGRPYPWGHRPLKGRAHRTWLRLGSAPVGNYPKSASPYGVQELGVNVAEWCSSQYRPYPYRADDGREALPNELPNPDAEAPPEADARLERVVRGAHGRRLVSGFFQSRVAYRPRVASRLSLEPYLVDEIGTRLVRSGRVV